VVEPCGKRAHTLKKGGPMFAMLSNDRGGNAEYVEVKATEAAAKPDAKPCGSRRRAACRHLQHGRALSTIATLKFGQRVLIHGGAGGVGHRTIQFARLCAHLS
jgi:NADPH:quinone reductase-like Zn-dependent oxidoreductase